MDVLQGQFRNYNSSRTGSHLDAKIPIFGVFRCKALKVIKGYRISNENYKHAWKLLKDTYDNKIIIIETHLDELLNFPVIVKENKANSIRQFVWHIRTHMTSLELLGQPVSQ